MTNVRVIRQENAGKPAALNNGVRNASYDIVVMMDGDTVFEPDAVHQLVQPFADPEIGAVAGNAKVGNRNTIIGAWQHIEYVMGFNLDRRMYDLLRCMPTIPGAIGAFRRDAVLEVGGMSEDTLAEDTDITIAMHRGGWRVVYQEHAMAWTEAPGSLKQLWSQRYRWSYGTMQALWKHRKSLTDKGPSGRFGRVGMPLVVIFQIITPVFAPLIDVFTVYSMIFVDFKAALLAWLAVLGIQLVCAAYAFRLDKEKYRYLLMMPLQQLAYRQMMYLVLIHSSVTALTGGRLRWQKLKRTGEVGTPAGAADELGTAAGYAEQHRATATATGSGQQPSRTAAAAVRRTPSSTTAATAVAPSVPEPRSTGDRPAGAGTASGTRPAAAVEPVSEPVPEAGAARSRPKPAASPPKPRPRPLLRHAARRRTGPRRDVPHLRLGLGGHGLPLDGRSCSRWPAR